MGQKSEQVSTGLSGKRVLIADRDDAMRVGVAALLRRRGAHVSTTEELEHSNHDEFDLVVLDPLIDSPSESQTQSFVRDLARNNPDLRVLIRSEFVDNLGALGLSSDRAALLSSPIRIDASIAEIERLLNPLGGADGEPSEEEGLEP